MTDYRLPKKLFVKNCCWQASSSKHPWGIAILTADKTTLVALKKSLSGWPRLALSVASLRWHTDHDDSCQHIFRSHSLRPICRQWDEEEKQRQQHTEPVVQAEEEDDSDDVASTKGGILHEEHFHETKIGQAGQNGHHDLEAAGSQVEDSMLTVLKIVDWWKVC